MKISFNFLLEMFKKKIKVENYESENLEIIENTTNGQLTIKGLSVFPIKHMNDLYDLLTAGVNIKCCF